MGYGYICKCPDCGYSFSAFLGKKDSTRPNEDTESKVYCCAECGHYEVITGDEQHCCIRCRGQLNIIDSFNEMLFGGSLKCPVCEGDLVVESALQEREWNTQRRYKRDVEGTTLSAIDDEGQYISFGCYPQGPNAEMLPIVWRILRREQGKIMLLSKRALDNGPYHNKEEETTWERCFIREWLNRDFLNTAFTKEQQDRIVTTDIVTGDYKVKDKVFFLNVEDIKEILGYSFGTQRAEYEGFEVCEPTDYALSFKKALVNEKGICWWLRSSGKTKASAAYVDFDIIELSGDEFYEEHGIRPAMWITVKESVSK